jgi:hypothetical protein
MAQENDAELQEFLRPDANTGLRLEKITIPGTNLTLYCDTTTGEPRPFLSHQPSDVPSSTRCITSLIQAFVPLQSLLQIVLYGPTSREIVASGPAHAPNASELRFGVTIRLLSDASHPPITASSTCTST